MNVPSIYANVLKNTRMNRGDKMSYCIQLCTLNKNAYHHLEMNRRVYSEQGASPVIRTHSGGGNVPLVLVGGPIRQKRGQSGDGVD